MGKTVIVTGASRGIGLAIARYLVSQGHNVIAVARNQTLLAQLEAENRSQIKTVAGDVRDSQLAARVVAVASSVFGQLHGLVINHGLMDKVATIAECDVDDWKVAFNVNFFSAVTFTQAALPALRETKGAIVYTSSGASTGSYKAWGAYTASKAALNALARQIACEEPKVSAFAIRPGVVDTDMQRDVREVHSASMADKDNAKFRTAFEQGSILKPEQPAKVMGALVVDPVPEVNGQYLSWDGEELARFR